MDTTLITSHDLRFWSPVYFSVLLKGTQAGSCYRTGNCCIKTARAISVSNSGHHRGQPSSLRGFMNYLVSPSCWTTGAQAGGKLGNSEGQREESLSDAFALWIMNGSGRSTHYNRNCLIINYAQSMSKRTSSECLMYANFSWTLSGYFVISTCQQGTQA